MNQPLSDTITRLRKERGLTQEQLGQLVGVSAQAVSKWEKGGAPDVELLPVLADRLGVSIDALFGRAEPSTADMTTQFQQWLLSMPIEKRFSALFEMLAVSSPYLGSNLMGSGIIPAISVQSTCYIDNMEQFVINYDMNVYKCTARDFCERYSIGRINGDGVFEPNNLYYKYYTTESPFMRKECLECELLPSCLYSLACLQKKIEGVYPECNKNSVSLSLHNEISRKITCNNNIK